MRLNYLTKWIGGIGYAMMTLFTMACNEVPGVNMQQIAHGQQLYETHCSNCHQADGKGLAMLIPPLLNADYIVDSAAQLPCIIQNGMRGPVEVNGSVYNLKMPGNNKLTVEEITAIVQFVQFRFAKQTTLLSKDSIQLMLNNCNN
ncbi:MAG: c-type cytochrome [Bacteroidota bacterium]